MEIAIWGIAGVVIGAIITQALTYWREKWQHDFKLRLELEKNKYEVRYKKVYEKVWDNLIELFPKLTRLKRELKSLFHSDLQFSSDPPTEHQYKTVAETFNDANGFLNDNRLLLPVPIFDEAKTFLDAVKAITNKFSSGYRKEQRHGDGSGNSYEDVWLRCQNKLKAMEPKYEKLHETMQVYLGFDKSDPK